MSEETLPITIGDVAFGGKGVARHNGCVVFVPFTITGEEVEVRVLRIKKKFAEAELVSVTAPSPRRVDPPCRYFQQCGGCTYQHIDYPHQLEIKSRQVAETLRRIGRLDPVPMRPIVPSPNPFGYRNRIRVHVEDGAVGYFGRLAHEIVEVEECLLASAPVNEALRELRARNPRDGHYTLSEPGRPFFFTQTNDAVAAAMVGLVRSLVSPGQTLLIDAYAGAGFFAKALAPDFQKTIGIEVNSLAVEAARAGASEKEKYLIGDVGERLAELIEWHDMEKTTLLLDPPATGLAPRVSDAVLGFPPAEIVYVSCNPATLARDLAILSRAYTLESVTPLDMFPQTSEIEVVTHLRRKPGQTGAA
jgi:23S rRNA (uracil1939-C5)-methyltransferase